MINIDLGIIAAIIYGCLALLGGIYGYVKVKSQASLISGIISGLLLIAAAIIELKGWIFGYYLGIIVTIGLIIVFGLRLSRTRKFMPSGLMLIAGIIALILMLS